MAQSALAVANTLIEIAKERKSNLSPLKLLKLAYFAHGWHLAFTGRPLVNESVEAWKFGPVFTSLYHKFKYYKDSPIEHLESTIDSDTFDEITPIVPKGDDSNQRPLIEKIWDVYGKLSAGMLTNLTHEPNSPWYQVWEHEGGKDRKHTDIPNPLIEAYFKKKLEQGRANREPHAAAQN